MPSAMPTSIYWYNNNDSFSSPPAPPLMAPFTLVEPTQRPTRSNSAVNFISRRQPARSPARNNNRRVQRARPSHLHPFDSLPWIAQMDSAPDAAICDIADLSQLPEVGPVRRRKTSLRSSPLRRPATLPAPSSTSSSSNDDSDGDVAPFAIHSQFTERCTTPPPRTRNDVSEIRFLNLMPQI